MPAEQNLPSRQEDLVIQEIENHTFIVKDKGSGSYFELGEREAFLLEELDGKHTASDVEHDYQEEFQEKLAPAELSEFVQMAAATGLVGERHLPEKRSLTGQSLLGYRIPFWDPDRFFTWLAPRISFFWTRAFVLLSGTVIALALFIVMLNHEALVSRFHAPWQLSAAIWVAFTLLVVTTLHEFGHGLTCKRHGGEVHEIGFLFLFFMPCLFCNVSDAWLIRDRRSRLWVTLAGGYVEACLWALAVFVWRISVQDSFLNYVAWMVICVSGVRIFFNFNPLLKLDGYYLLSDVLRIPNLREVSITRITQWIRCLLWGGARPCQHDRATTLQIYGSICWVISAITMSTVVLHLTNLSWQYLGTSGLAFGAMLGIVGSKRILRGTDGGEIRTMLSKRHKRAAIWIGGFVGVLLILCFVPMQKRATGSFSICPLARQEIRAPVAAFLRTSEREEGDLLEPDGMIGTLDVPDLESRIKNKKAELAEVEAHLRLLKAGTREEELSEQRQRVDRSRAWRDLAQADARKAQLAFDEDSKVKSEKINQVEAELQQAKVALDRSSKLFKTRIVSAQQHEEDQKRVVIADAALKQAQAEETAHDSLGITKAQEEVARREKELSDEVGKLAVLEAGTRSEEIEAEEASRKRVLGELNYLEETKSKLPLKSAIHGVIVTPRLKEKVGQHFAEGDLICQVDSIDRMEVEITVPEQEVADVQPGNLVELKVRALPFTTLQTVVTRVAPAAKDGELHSTVAVYCDLSDIDPQLRPGMTGFARIYCGARPVGQILFDKILKYVRTEFWW